MRRAHRRTAGLQVLTGLLIAAGLGPASPTSAGDPEIVKPGPSSARGSVLKAFDARWIQRIPAAEGWQASGEVWETMTETLDRGRKHWVRTQTASRGPVSFVNKTVFDAATMKPIYFERAVGDDVSEEIRGKLADAGFALGFRIDFEDTGFTKTTPSSSGTPAVETGKLLGPAFDGSVLGLVVATLPLASDYSARLPVVFVAPNDGSITEYFVDATVHGVEQVSTGDGTTEEAWRVDVAWVDPTSGEVTSPGGPDQAGGAYWVIPDPSGGRPFVPKYRNESVDFELTRPE